ncbi:hypothetical protein DPMN_068031 [Dreissena polymorpha]|uniref:Uncharacterized protein n=1 Tax=Dreissena polymorpha TaxID=45954 RepID=A0A9D3Z0T6_DREPO|nr:hypothetical protein DPMN_068031 [Dreissena polymorpha]
MTSITWEPLVPIVSACLAALIGVLAAHGGHVGRDYILGAVVLPVVAVLATCPYRIKPYIGSSLCIVCIEKLRIFKNAVESVSRVQQLLGAFGGKSEERSNSGD